MHRNRFAICPKCEKFTLLDPDAGPTVYCGHFLENHIIESLNPNVSGEITHVERITCKVITIGEPK